MAQSEPGWLFCPTERATCTIWAGTTGHQPLQYLWQAFGAWPPWHKSTTEVGLTSRKPFYLTQASRGATRCRALGRGLLFPNAGFKERKGERNGTLFLLIVALCECRKGACPIFSCSLTPAFHLHQTILVGSETAWGSTVPIILDGKSYQKINIKNQTNVIQEIFEYLKCKTNLLYYP